MVPVVVSLSVACRKYFSFSLLFLLSFFKFRFSLVNFLCHNLGLVYLQLILDKLGEIRLDKCCHKDETLFAKYKKMLF